MHALVMDVPMSRNARRGRPIAPEFRWVDAALEEWARHVCGGISGMGWDRITMLGKIIEFGVRGAAQSGGSVQWPESVDFTEKAVLRLKPADQRVIRRAYLDVAPEEYNARRCGLSVTAYRSALSRARRHVAFYLEGQIENIAANRYLTSRP